MKSKLALGVVPLLFLVACGGVVRLDGDGSSNDYDSGVVGTGGAASGIGGSGPGRAGSGPGYGGVRGTGGRSGATGGWIGAGGAIGVAGGIGCCLAIATCDPGDKQIATPEECPPGFACYGRSACCSTVTCISLKGCGAPPFCSPGEAQLKECPPYPSSCYMLSSCGMTVACMPMMYPTYDGGAPPPQCNPATEYNRNYFGLSPSACAVIDYACPNFTTGFGNECGCGCEQNPACPEWVDCMPSNAPPDRFCSDAGRAQCPYTGRAL